MKPVRWKIVLAVVAAAVVDMVVAAEAATVVVAEAVEDTAAVVVAAAVDTVVVAAAVDTAAATTVVDTVVATIAAAVRTTAKFSSGPLHRDFFYERPGSLLPGLFLSLRNFGQRSKSLPPCGGSPPIPFRDQSRQ
jgi:hypothetical protein